MLTLEEGLAGFAPPEEVKKQWGRVQVMNNCYLSSGEGVVWEGYRQGNLVHTIIFMAALRLGSC